MSRIVAGTAGGRRLASVPGDATRPTTDRVKEAVFSTLAAWLGTSDAPVEEQLTGVAFLDLYAGSGAIGLEAASRGASPVVLVDAATPAVRTMRANVRESGLVAEVVSQKAETYLAGPGVAFDIVWLDPPYAVSDDAVAGVLQRLWQGGWLRPDALVCVERSTRSASPFDQADLPRPLDAWSRRYGETTIHFAQSASDSSPDEPTAVISDQAAEEASR